MHVDICCIGHLTIDKIITPSCTVVMPGGTSYYFSHAISRMDVRYGLITALADTDMQVVEKLRENGLQVKAFPISGTVFFENSYGKNLDHRRQKVLHEADPFSPGQMEGVEAGIFHLGTLLKGDIPASVINMLAKKGKISLDVQGCLRTVHNQQVIPDDWKEKKEIMPCIQFLKANEEEVKVVTGVSDPLEGAKILAAWGVQEVVLTLGSKGSVIHHEGQFYRVPAFRPAQEVDATGCGDTYMAGYLYQRSKGIPIQPSGEFAAAMAAMKMEKSGPFNGTEDEVRNWLEAKQSSSLF